MPDTLSLALNHGEQADNVLYRLRREEILRISPGSTLLGKKIVLYTNYPATEKGEFVREKYRILQWHSRDGKVIEAGVDCLTLVNDLDIYCEIPCNKSGSFRFYFSYEKNGKPEGSLYILIEPKIYVGPPKARKYMPLDSIRCQTVLAKLLGPINTWEAKLLVGKESGYNMIHFTPVQQLGESRSCYSLADQLKVNPEFAAKPGGKITYDDVEKITKKLREEWGIASICDIVLNHTANESEWVKEHPESTYSCFTCPHLRPAFLLDALLVQVGADVKEGKLENHGVPKVIETEDHLQALKHQVHSHYLPQIKLHEFFQVDVEKCVAKFEETIKKMGAPPPPHRPSIIGFEDQFVVPQRVIINFDPEYRRHKSCIDLDKAVKMYNLIHHNAKDEEHRVKICVKQFRKALLALNDCIQREVDADMEYAINNCIAGTRYERVQHDGPRIKEISIQYPLFQNYFTKWNTKGKSIKEIEQFMYADNGKYFMAHNGWVMGSDPLQDFASPREADKTVYFRRELVAWGDSVKLRYGSKPEDNPYLWEHMRKYVDTTAKIFDGVRLDNCHSTPLHVAEYLLDSARKINPELYVVAELFTNSDATDNIFVNRLGINSLIREAQAAWDSHEEGRLVYRYGGAPVGAFFVSPKRPIAPNIAHALFLDLTHDNPSPVDKRSVFDYLPTGALVAMACCATGSNRGYDELVPHHIHVVNEERQYQEWNKHVTHESGMIAARKVINLLHGEMAEQGFNQVFVDQMHPDVVAVTRHSPKTHQTIVLIAHTAFYKPDPNSGPTGVRPVTFEGELNEIILEANITHKNGPQYQMPTNYKKDDKYINGYDEYLIRTKEHIQLKDSEVFVKDMQRTDTHTILHMHNLRPGTVVAIRASLKEYARVPLEKLIKIVDDFLFERGAYLELKKVISNLDLVDLNHALYCCESEERDLTGCGSYHIPNFANMVYCGFQGIVSHLSEISPKDDMGHPICGNLRDGNWMLDYFLHRLLVVPNLKPLGEWLKPHFDELKSIPRYMIPSYFDVIITGVYNALVEQAYNLMSDFVKNGSTFCKMLALGSVQFLSRCKSSGLPKVTADQKIEYPTLSAGLPHFSTGYMRCWGRDTFIALPGLTILTGRYEEAKQIILSFGTTLRHGLIPNLLDGGKNPRYNCRDAIWWWLYCIKKFATEVPNGELILKEKISRIFPTDDSEAKAPGEHMEYLYDTIQEALTKHFQGLAFRERNAGTLIDAHMKDEGFNNKIGVDLDTGFVFGGNALNCGTWMDKMGSCDKSGNRGIPSTPRDGSAVELVGLQFAALRFLQKMAEKKVIPYSSVTRKCSEGSTLIWSYKDWADKIADNFESKFFVGPNGVPSPPANKRNIYKDSCGATYEWADYQLRPNFTIAMVAAPEIFDPQNAWQALENARKYLLGPLGMKTLDPEDWGYRGNYDNSIDCDDPKISHGANYHQGPEWLWPIGFYLRARLHFAKLNNCLEQTVAETWSILTKHLHEIETSHWRGLPELTNENGAYCKDSCRTQAWSMSCVLETLYDLENL
uniref:Glycogen debranching enzyme n=1 Tax=Culicoides sonorensis TaxID=179676 RepID=A0A336MYR3_CULSO